MKSRTAAICLRLGMIATASAAEPPNARVPIVPMKVQDIKAYCLDFNGAATSRRGKPYAAPGLWAGADPAQLVAWYKAMGANVIKTFGVSCNGRTWYRNGFVTAQPRLRLDFLPEVVMRKDLGIAKLPFVIANTGMGGWDNPPQYKAKVEKLMEAQLALAKPEKYPEFTGNVAGVETRDFQRKREESPSRQDYHWFRNWETLYLIGKSMGGAMLGLEPGSANTSR